MTPITVSTTTKEAGHGEYGNKKASAETLARHEVEQENGRALNLRDAGYAG
jgi:hypothetical protein